MICYSFLLFIFATLNKKRNYGKNLEMVWQEG